MKREVQDGEVDPFYKTPKVRSYIHACTNETHSIANLQDLIPTLAVIVCVSYNYAVKVEIESCRFVIECVSFVHVTSYPAGIVFALTDTNSSQCGLWSG